MTPIRSLIILCLFLSCRTNEVKKEKNNNEGINLVLTNHWFIAGPAVESENEINRIRKNDHILRVTAHDSPSGEIELNVPIVPIDASVSNEGVSVNLSDDSNFVEVTYRSSHPIALQAREGNEEGTACLHGGNQPRVDMPPSPNTFTTVKIPWKNFRLNGDINGKLLNINNLCKFNFVNYHPVTGAVLEITSMKLEHYKK